MTTISDALVNGLKRLNEGAVSILSADQKPQVPMKLSCNLCDEPAKYEAFSPEEETLHYFLCENPPCHEKVKRLGWAVQIEGL